MKYLAIILFVTCLSLGYGQVNEVLNIGVSGQEIIGIDSYQDENGNLYFCGNRYTNNNQGQFFISKYNSSYEIQWSKVVGHVTGAGPAFMLPHPDGGVLIKISQDYTLGYRSLIIRISDSGSIIWRKTTDLPGSLGNVRVLNNGNILISLSGSSQLVLMDSNGSIIWTKELSYPGNSSVPIRDMVETLDGNIMLFATVGGAGQPVPMLSLIKINMLGDVIFMKHFVVPQNNTTPYGSIQASDSSFYFITAREWVFGNTDRDVVVRKFDKNGNYVIGKSYGTDYFDYGWDIMEGNSGLIHISTTLKPVAVCGGNSVFMTLDPTTLDTIQTRGYGTSQGNGSFFVKLHQQGDQIYSASWGSLFTQIGAVDGHIMRTDESFDLPCLAFNQPIEVTALPDYIDSVLTISYTNGVDPLFVDTLFSANIDSLLIADACTGDYLSVDELLKNDVYVYPNPVSNILSFSKRFEEVQIYDCSGRLVKSAFNKEFIDVGLLNPGVYYLLGSSFGETIRTKFVKTTAAY